MDSLIISLLGNVNNTKFIKKIPMNLDQREIVYSPNMCAICFSKIGGGQEHFGLFLVDFIWNDPNLFSCTGVHNLSKC